MEIFIVLFWGTIWAVRILADKHQSAKADREIKANIHSKEVAIERWIADVCDEDLEEEIEYYVHDPKNRSEVRQTVLNAFAEAGMTHLNYDETDAIRVYLAGYGKLMMHDAKSGILVITGAQTKRAQREEISDRRKFVMWIDSKLKENGINEDMFVHTTGSCYFTPESDEYRCGYFMWRPSINPSFVKNL